MTATLTTPIKLSNNTITTAESDLGLVALDANGLAISTGNGYYSSLSYLPVEQRNTLQYLSAFDGQTSPTTLTTALFKNIHLVEGQTLSITFQYHSTEAGNPAARSVAHQAAQNDFAFASLASPTNPGAFNYLINTDLVNALHGTNVTTYGTAFKITQSGDYSLVIGNADVGDTSLNSTLTVQSITITTPDTGRSAYTPTPTGVKFIDGSQLLANGSEILPSGQSIPGFLSAGGQQLIAYAIDSNAAIVSHDAGGIVSHDAGGIVAGNTSNLISQDGGSLISQDGGGIVAGNTSNLISQDGGGIVSHDAGGIVATGGGNFIPRISPYKSGETTQQTGPDLVVTTAFLDRTSAAAGDVVNVSYQVKSGGTQSVASSTSTVYLSTDRTITASDTTLGSLVDPGLAAGNAVSDTLDVRLPAGLRAGTYYLGVIADANAQVSETDEGNNVSASLPITVARSGPFTPAAVTLAKLSPDVAAGNFLKQVAAGDVNGDGKLDLVVVGGEEASVLLGRGDGTFARQPAITVGGEPSTMALVDVNGDGKLDIVTGGFGDQTARVYIGQGDGTFVLTSQATFPIDRFVGLDVADVTGDGKPDIIQAGNNGYSVAAGNGDGTFQAPVLTPTSAALDHVVAADVNGDGRRDIVTTQPNTNQVTVTAGGGAFASVSLPVGTSPFSLAVADIDGDGAADIVVGTNNGNVVTDDNLVVLLGHGDGTFSAPITTVLGRATRAIAVGDLNGDGYLDVVTANGGYDINFNYTATVLLGRGDGTFASGATLVTGSDPDSVALADIDGDGKLDVVVANFSDGSTSLFLNTTAVTPVTTPTPSPDTTPASGSARVTPAGSTAAGTHDLAFTDGYGHSVIDTLDAGDRLLKEVVKDAGTGSVVSTMTLTYRSDGTYDQHTDLVTTAGALTVDAVYGPKGQLSEIQRDGSGQITSTATVTYRDDGTIARHTTTAGQPGFDDFVYSSAFGAQNGGFLSHIHTDAAGHVTSIDVDGQPVVPPASPENQPYFGTIGHGVQDVAGQAFALYDGLLQRAPDPLGGENLAAALKAGASLHDLAQSILDAPETRTRLNAPDNAGFVEQLYETVLGRHGDDPGAATWVDALDHGAARADVALGFVFSNENVGQIAGALAAGVFVADSATSDVARLFHGVLDRAPDAGGLQFWTAADQGGVALKAVAESFLASSEYGSSHATPPGDAQFVESLYGAALGRPAEATGLAGWLDALAHGASRADVALGIVESAEAHQHLAPVIEAGWHLA